MRIGLVGCGRISKNHFDAIKQFPDDLELAAVCDVVKARSQSAAEENSAAWYTDLAKMLAKENLDIVSICTPSGMHPQHGIMAAQAGCHVITEKPMGITLKDADALIQACDEHKVELFVVKQNRLNTTMQLLKNAINKGRFGQIYMVQSNVFWARPQEYYDQAKWRGTWEFDGGAYMNQASHYVDALTWLVGNPEYVMAVTGTLARKIEAEDTGTAIIKFRNGVIGSMSVTMLTFPKNFEGSITILGEKGTAKIGGVAVNKIEKWEFQDYDDDDRLVEEANYSPPNVYGFGHLGYYKNVVASLKGESEAFTDGRSGRKSLELILAIYKSAQTGKRVSLPLNFS
ncbi:MAG: Gfo/Idh/MocA family oxidoreductase [Lentisphaeria bacterium]|nr:Gfo/Idh/MocA family oxidoreductase [Candidatus Neomarinimicrobiota bacterium]MCF7841825.1 Gfo/Idh/MocA family oxidoreductase [Lentisphaeria bacterium]